MILVLGHVVARPETLDRVLDVGRDHVERSRAEPGCVSHDMARDAENPLKVRFIEEWADMDAPSAPKWPPCARPVRRSRLMMRACCDGCRSEP
jgi:hypothetical protein